MNPEDRTFVELSDAGGDTPKRRRSSVEPLGSLEFLESFQKGRRLKPPRKVPVVKIEPPALLEDMPWSMKVPVVSDRFRRFLEQEAPDNAQFFKVQFRGPKKLIPSQDYYLANWTHLIDCIDFARSEWRDTNEDPDGAPNYHFVRKELDPDKVPSDVRIFRLEHFHVMTVIDLALADKIREAGITGPQFYPVNYSYLDEL